MKKIVKLAKKYKLKIIEDCSQAHGAKIDKKYVGTFGDVSVWSFCNDKILNTLGEGGIVATKNFKLYKKLWSLKDCGKNYLKLLKKLNNAFISLGFGANGVDLHEMISFNFVEPVMLDKLKEVSRFTINKYKRAY